MQHRQRSAEEAGADSVQDLQHASVFPEALGTGIVMHTARPIDDDLYERLRLMIEDYEAVLSRFREDSLLSTMSRAQHGGSFDFPDYLAPLFEMYDGLFDATHGAIDPLVGSDLVKLGYGPDLAFHAIPHARDAVGTIHGRANWGEAVTRHGTTLITRQALHLDFGAAGKGFMVDLLAAACAERHDHYLIDAGGDLRIECLDAVRVALEDPFNEDEAVGMANLTHASLCASAPSRRRWTVPGEKADGSDTSDCEGGPVMMHHLLNAIDGMPANEVAATWVTQRTSSDSASRDHANGAVGIEAFPTALADGLSTALFVCDPSSLAESFEFECAVVLSDRSALLSRDFPGHLFTA
ncbi:MAG: FAD:protein FMN transferase [Bifidobacterium psychraerophilum]|uniref:FAD:protein FMN transferase n=2 Tax=Bifidobacterium psychraerophilum TaxID=218140 RepID=UPI0039EB7A61